MSDSADIPDAPMNAVGASPRAIDRLFAHYGESHRHPINLRIHWVFVPLIVWSTLAMCWAIHPYAAMAIIVPALIYYFTLSIKMAIFQVASIAVSVGSFVLIPHLLWVAITVYVVSWIGQFIGHHIEGRKPSFVDDLLFQIGRAHV